MDASTPQNPPLPPPPQGAVPAPAQESVAARAPEPTISPSMPAAHSNRMPQMAGATAQPYVPPKPERAERSRTKVYALGTVIFLAISIAGYIGFRSYIYGDDAPPVPVLDDLGN